MRLQCMRHHCSCVGSQSGSAKLNLQGWSSSIFAFHRASRASWHAIVSQVLPRPTAPKQAFRASYRSDTETMSEGDDESEDGGSGLDDELPFLSPQPNVRIFDATNSGDFHGAKLCHSWAVVLIRLLDLWSNYVTSLKD